VIGCVGGGSNFPGGACPFLSEKLRGRAEKETEFIAVESTACPSLSKGKFLYDHGDTERITPRLKMFTLGHEFVPDPIHAGGLRYHGMAPAVSLLVRDDLVKARAYN